MMDPEAPSFFGFEKQGGGGLKSLVDHEDSGKHKGSGGKRFRIMRKSRRGNGSRPIFARTKVEDLWSETPSLLEERDQT